MTAASSGNTEIVQMLVEANADINAEDKVLNPIIHLHDVDIIGFI